MTNRFPKLAKATPMTETTAIKVAIVFIKHWIAKFGLPSKVFTDNGPQLTSKFFQEIREELGVKRLKATE